MTTYTRIYGTVDEMLKASDQAHAAGRRYYRDGQIEDNAGWIGRHYKGWDEVQAEANSDWPVGQRIVAEMLAKLSSVELPAPVSVKRRACWSEDGGDELDNDRLRAGQEYWRTTRRQSTRSPRTISVVASVSTSYGHKPEDVIWRGAAAVVLANLLENAGYQVELWAADYSRRTYKDGASRFTGVCLKRADQPVDVATVINAVSGWFYRLVFFQEHFVETRSEADAPGLGFPQPLSRAGEQIAEMVGNADTVLIDGVFDECAAVAKIRQVILSLNQ